MTGAGVHIGGVGGSGGRSIGHEGSGAPSVGGFTDSVREPPPYRRVVTSEKGPARRDGAIRVRIVRRARMREVLALLSGELLLLAAAFIVGRLTAS